MKVTNTDQLMSLGSFSQLVSIPPGSRVTVMSGQTALSASYQLQGGDDLLAQARFAMANVRTALAAVDADLSRVAKLKCYVVGMNSGIAAGLPVVLEEEGASSCALTIIGVASRAA